MIQVYISLSQSNALCAFIYVAGFLLDAHVLLAITKVLDERSFANREMY